MQICYNPEKPNLFNPLKTKIQNEGLKSQETFYPSMKSSLKQTNNLKGKLEVLKRTFCLKPENSSFVRQYLENHILSSVSPKITNFILLETRFNVLKLCGRHFFQIQSINHSNLSSNLLLH